MKKYTLLQKHKLMRKYKKYADMKKEGKSPREIYLTAKSDDLNSLERLEILWNVCELSFGDAKELMICANTGVKSLSEYQEKHVLPALKEAFDIEAQELKGNEENSKHNS